MLKQQRGKCAICKTEPYELKRLSVDHCHEAGKVRGLLCVKCNAALALLGGDLVLLKKAIAYLQHHKNR
jgi:Autographiviridae endonuclease VII